MKLFKKEEEKKHVGRPTNEEVKKRKTKKILKVFVPLLIFILFIVGICLTNVVDIDDLKGAAVSSYGGSLRVSASNSKTRQKDCYMVIPMSIKNTSDKRITVSQIGVKYYGSGNHWIQKQSGSQVIANNTIPSKKTVGFSLLVDLKKLDASVTKLTIIVYFNNGNNYTTENLKIGSVWYDRIKACKTTTTTKKDSDSRRESKSKTGLKISCPSSAKVGQVFTCKTNAAGAKISVSSNGLASGYNTSFTTTSSDRTKQSKYAKAGTVTVTVSKNGYSSVSTKVKIVNSSSNSGGSSNSGSSTKLNGSCKFTNVSTSASGIHHYVKYSTSCTGNAKVTNIAYKTPVSTNNKFVNRGSGWGSVKGGTSTIDFHARNVGKQATLRVYYDTNSNSTSRSHYSDYKVTVK